MLVSLLHLALGSLPTNAATVASGGSSSLWEVTKEKASPILGSSDSDKVDLFSSTFPSGYDGFDLSGALGDYPSGLGQNPGSNPIFSDFMKPGEGHAKNGAEALVKTDRNSELSTKLENALFDNFGREIGMYYGCRSDKDVDWYLKRTFERLKNTIVQYPDLTSITLSEEQIAEKIQANLGKPLNATSDRYVKQLAEYSKRLSNGIVKKRTEPGIDWSERLGGGKGVLRDAGLVTEAADWNKVGNGAIFSAPKTGIRGEGICTVKSTAKDRDAANRVMEKKITYNVASDVQVQEDMKQHSATAENYKMQAINRETNFPKPTQQDYKTVKDLGALAAIVTPPAVPGLASSATDTVPAEVIEDAKEMVAKHAQEKNREFWKKWENNSYDVAAYQAIWKACLEKNALYSVAFEDLPQIQLVEAFEQNLDRSSICREACRRAGQDACDN